MSEMDYGEGPFNGIKKEVIDFNIENFQPGDFVEVRVGARRDTIVSGVVIETGIEHGNAVIDYKLDDDVVTRFQERWCYLGQVASHKRFYPERGTRDVDHSNVKELCNCCGNEYHPVRENEGDYFHCSVCKCV